MREAPTKFWKSKNLITKEGYPTNQNVGNNQLNLPHKKSILEDSYINQHFDSRPQLRQLSILPVKLNLLCYYSQGNLANSKILILMKLYTHVGGVNR